MYNRIPGNTRRHAVPPVMNEAVASVISAIEAQSDDPGLAQSLYFGPTALTHVKRLVEMEPQAEFVSKIPGAKLVKIPASKHEIYLSVNEAMEPYLQAIFAFLAE